MSFVFIDNNADIDRATRKRIRTHAATGKNANRTLTRPSRTKAIVRKDSSATPFRVPETITRARRDKTADEEVPRPVTDGLLFPIPVPETSKGLVREALFFFSGVRYNPELDGALENPSQMGSIWVQYFFLDEAYFHCSVATTILCSRNLVRETAQGMYHIARTYRIVQKRLRSQEEATSDMTMAILVAMSQYERLQGQFERGYVHLQGLRRMVELRGGIRHFDSESCGVIQKVLRADLEFALQLGSRTLSGVEGIEFLRLCKGVCIHDGKMADRLTDPGIDSHLQMSLRADLWTIFSDMRSLAMLLNNADAGHRQKLDAVGFHNTIMLLGFRLLHIGPLDTSTDSGTCPNSSMSILEEAVHLGLVAFLVTFLRGLDHRVADKPLLSSRLRLAIQKMSSAAEEGAGGEFMQRVLLWMLFIGAVVVFKPSDDEWLIPTTNNTMKALGLSSWDEVKKTSIRFPWVHAIHDRAGMVLCSTQKFLEFSIQDHLP
ncbi:hypothetical protein BDW74DRAFT_173596 [Aspergillus multicolor]|uniref:uncharacterized protein n=1 Tax=Aspergillus multicolor TaxID=41759 RepID=UPI003CCCE0AF